MSQINIIEPDTAEDIPQAVSFKVLLGFYLIIPLCLGIQIIDSQVYAGELLTILPSSPAHFVLLQVLLGTPHIIASAILVTSNREYLARYKSKLLWMSGLILLVFGFGSLIIPHKVLYIISACWTVYHVLKQQQGIGRGLYKLPNREFYLILWLSILAGIFIYMGIFLKNSLTVQQTEWIKHLAASFTIGLVLTSFLAQRYIYTKLGKYFLWANTILIVSSFYLYDQKYYFLAILIPRLIHDASAYLFYITHDYNKHHLQAQNKIYKFTQKLRLPIILVLPIISIGLTIVLQLYGDAWINFLGQAIFNIEIRKAITLGLIGYLSLMHYYSESFLWQRGSLLRAFIKFKT